MASAEINLCNQMVTFSVKQTDGRLFYDKNLVSYILWALPLYYCFWDLE